MAKRLGKIATGLTALVSAGGCFFGGSNPEITEANTQGHSSSECNRCSKIVADNVEIGGRKYAVMTKEGAQGEVYVPLDNSTREKIYESATGLTHDVLTPHTEVYELKDMGVRTITAMKLSDIKDPNVSWSALEEIKDRIVKVGVEEFYLLETEGQTGQKESYLIRREGAEGVSRQVSTQKGTATNFGVRGRAYQLQKKAGN